MPILILPKPKVYCPSSLMLTGETLPALVPGIAYSQDISGQATGGTPPYIFSLLSQAGPDVFAVSSAGVITSPAIVPNIQVTGLGEYIVTENGDLQVT